MRTRHLMVLAMAGMVGAACEPRDDPATEPGLLPGEELAPAQPADMIVSRGEFQPTAEAEGLPVSGWAELRQQGTTLDDGLELRVHLMGLSEGDYAWHIHSGTCENPGPILLPLSDAGMMGDPALPREDDPVDRRDGIADDLSVGGDGMAEETVNIDGDRARELDFQRQSLIVNVHRGPGDAPGPGIACAPLQTAGITPGAQPETTPGTEGTEPRY